MSDERRPLRVEALEERDGGGYKVYLEDGEGEDSRLGPLSEEELRWLGIVLIPAALPPLRYPDRSGG